MLIAPAIIFIAGQIPLGPTLPPGVHPAFQQGVILVEERLEKSDFDGASKLLPLLVKSEVRYSWNDTAVPAAERTEFAQQRDRILTSWSNILRDIKFVKSADKPDIKFSFAKRLPVPPGKTMPSGSALFFSETPEGPRMEVVIGLERGDPAQPTQPMDIYNETAFCIGSYLGIAPSQTYPTSMGKLDAPSNMEMPISPGEMAIVRKNRLAVGELQAAIAKKRPLAAGRPEAFVDPKQIECGSIIQGDEVDFSVQVTNNGTGTLQYRPQPDCGCMATTGMQTVAPGASSLIRVRFGATEFYGDVHRRLLLFSNDAERPVIEIPVHIEITPFFRFLAPAGEVTLVKDGGTDVTVYLAFADGSDVNVSQVRLDGLPGEAKYEEWKGSLPDPLIKEPAKPRHGYKFTVNLKDALPPGRSYATLLIATDNPKFPALRYGIYAQKGIVGLPDQVYYGDIGASPRRTTFLVTRPEVPFKIMKIESESPHFTFAHKSVRGEWEHEVTVDYDGKAPSGPLEGLFKIYTDDPKQKVVYVQYKALVK